MGRANPLIGVAGTGFAWLGVGVDQVGTWGRGTPDGGADGHFSLTLPADGRAITSIAVYSSDASDQPQGGQIWHTSSSAHWILGIGRRGARLNGSHAPSLGVASDGYPLDLCCSDSGYFKPGQRFMVEVIYADGAKVRHVTGL